MLSSSLFKAKTQLHSESSSSDDMSSSEVASEKRASCMGAGGRTSASQASSIPLGGSLWQSQAVPSSRAADGSLRDRATGLAQGLLPGSVFLTNKGASAEMSANIVVPKTRPLMRLKAAPMPSGCACSSTSTTTGVFGAWRLITTS